MEKKSESKKNEQEELEQFVNKNIHKVRNCIDYYEEYYECKRIKGRFHQYFVHGKMLNCSNWKSDYYSCLAAEEDKDKNLDKLASIIRHEDERREQRLRDHLNNDVWPRRTHPPSNWNNELPEWLVQKELEEEPQPSRCIIS